MFSLSRFIRAPRDLNRIRRFFLAGMAVGHAPTAGYCRGRCSRHTAISSLSVTGGSLVPSARSSEVGVTSVTRSVTKQDHFVVYLATFSRVC